MYCQMYCTTAVRTKVEFVIPVKIKFNIELVNIRVNMIKQVPNSGEGIPYFFLMFFLIFCFSTTGLCCSDASV